MKTIFALLLGVALIQTSFAQKDKKPWTEWSRKEAENILNKSGWGQMQTDTDTDEMFFRPTHSSGRAPNAAERAVEGATNQSTNVFYGIRFFSARPIRQAFVRMMQLRQKDLAPDVLERMKNFAEVPAADSIIVAVTIEGTDKRSLGHVMQVINSSVTGTLKNTTYLERSDGKRLFLQEYVPPGRDGFGARFIFPRTVDQAPFLGTEFSEVRFVSDIDPAVKLNKRFKLADMLLDGKLEY